MKRNFKMSWAFNVILGAFLLSMGSCKEEELIFPKQGDQETIVTETRPTARPTNLTFVSAFNQKLEIHWPALSDRVVKAEIRYTEGAEEKVITVSKFDEPTIITLKDYKDYTVTVQYFTSDGTASKLSKVSLKPGPYEAAYKLTGLTLEPVPGGIKFVFPKTSDRAIATKISYVLDGKEVVRTFDSNKESEVVISNLTDETKEVAFKILTMDEELKVAVVDERKQAPGVLAYKGILETMVAFMDGNNGGLAWTNLGKDPATIIVNYQLNGQSKTVRIDNSTDVEKRLLFDLQGKPTAFTFTIETDGLTSPVQDAEVKAPTLLSRSTWSAEVSSTESQEGAANGKASSLIDGDIGTYWHSTWSSSNNPVYPHWFIVDLGKVESFAQFGMIRRHNNNTGGFKTFNIETSLDKASWTMVGKDLFFDSAGPAVWHDYNVSMVKARYVRITMTEPMRAGATSTHLAEFRAAGYAPILLK
ncbi:discoidin domain-containing protein [Sphingobacterium sp. DR205]|uniref:discoidin domain-containing protein n=1 Tax=Sphingobacterium sp. DR205 TaxID=2713573 RepID=UPI0013E4B596|nr:discoidin domain-containing protein [Sphingobacterium sp. DR205]QIH31707.1 discoidin domain-containing protein [Sphingobacterium sp. DR205]